MDFGQGLTNAWSSVATFIPRFLLFAVILGVGYFVAKMLSTATNKMLERVGFDKAVERGGIRKVLAKSQYDASDLMAKVVFYAVMLFVLKLAFNAFGSGNAVSALLDSVIAYLPQVFAAALIIVVASAIGAAVREILDATLSSRPYGTTVANVAGSVFLAIGLFAALDQMNIAQNITNAIFYAVLAAFVGVTIVAVGGSGIKPMQQVWEQSITKVTEESKAIKEQSGDAKSRLAERAQQRKAQAQQAARSNQGEQAVDVREQPAPASYASGVTDPWDEAPSDETRRRPQGF